MQKLVFYPFQDSSIFYANQKSNNTRKCECLAKILLLLKPECQVEHSNIRFQGFIPFSERRKREEQARSELCKTPKVR